MEIESFNKSNPNPKDQWRSRVSTSQTRTRKINADEGFAVRTNTNEVKSNPNLNPKTAAVRPNTDEGFAKVKPQPEESMQMGFEKVKPEPGKSMQMKGLKDLNLNAKDQCRWRVSKSQIRARIRRCNDQHSWRVWNVTSSTRSLWEKSIAPWSSRVSLMVKSMVILLKRWDVKPKIIEALSVNNCNLKI